jgi:CBS domain containing-hemolysin-like protein
LEFHPLQAPPHWKEHKPVAVDALLVIALSAGAFCSLAAIGARTLREFSRSDLQEICTRNDDSNTFGEILRGHERAALGLEMLVVIGAALAAGSGLFWILNFWHGDYALRWEVVVLYCLGLGVLIAVVKVCIPWSVSRLFAAPFLYHTWPLWRVVSFLAAPLVWAVQVVDNVGHRIFGRTPPDPSEESLEEEIRTIVTEGHREGLLEEDAREMIEGVIDLGDGDVVQIMTPRTDMHMIQVDLEWDELLSDVIRVGHTRIPVYAKNRDDIVGILYVKDMLPELAKDPSQPRRPLREILRKPMFVPETKAVDALLEMFQQMRTHIAIVLDEYGGVSGLVTIEDVLEEIVGEIVDEYDQDVEQGIHIVDENTVEALGRTHVEEINAAMDLALPEDEDFDTIGGFVFSELGRVPMVGESLVWNDAVKVTVLEATRRRIDRVRVERMQRESVEAV